MNKVIIVLVIVILSISLFGDIRKGLVAYYPFNGNVNDESGNGNNGINYGATLTTDRFGNEKSAYKFDGNNDYIIIKNKLSLSSSSFTWCAWFKMNKLPQTAMEILSQTGHFNNSSTSDVGWRHLCPTSVRSNTKIRFNFMPTNDKQGGWDDTLLSNTKLKINNWYFVVITFNGNEMKLFLNNSLEKKMNATYKPSNAEIYIGFMKNAPVGYYFNGSIDDILIYNRAISEIEINKIYNEKTKIIKNKEKSNLFKQTFPPDLYIENLKFYEPSKNKALDGLEKGNIKFDIVNKGRGNAYDIEINITPLTSSQNLSFKTKTDIDQISKKGSKNISIPISADINVKDLFREFRIEVTERNGFDTDPAKISFETLTFASPNLKVEQIAIDDNEDAEGEGFSYGNGNSTIEPNESIEVTAYVQNFGEGPATNVKAKIVLTSSNRDITYPDEGKIFNLGDIESGAYRKVEFYFYTSRRYDDDNIPLSIEITENTGKFGKTSDLGLKLGDRTKNIVDVQVSKIHKNKKTKMKELDNIVILSDVDKNIPETNIDGKKTLAIIIGIEDYKYAPTVDFASNDARVFYQYSKSVFGIPERNIYYRINDGATSGEFNKIFAEDGWIARRLKKEKTDVIVYYSGHGAPDTKSEKGYLIPHDIDPNYANTGVSLDFIYSSLSKLKAKSVTLFIDACFSGESRSEEMLIAGIRPISVKIKNPILTTENMAVFSASTGEQYSSAYPEKQHGLFTYFLLKGLKGKAKGSDNKITLDELQSYIYKNVGETAGFLDKEQNPTFIGKNKSRVIIKY